MDWADGGDRTRSSVCLHSCSSGQSSVTWPHLTARKSEGPNCRPMKKIMDNEPGFGKNIAISTTNTAPLGG